VNCGAIPENLVESVLFGHEKGAFTGAAERHAGKFIEASGGTLFLDEIGELPLAAQVKLLRTLQAGEVDPVGAKKPVKVDVRIISATNRDLIADVRAGRFREDLYYRLCVFPISVPALRERAEDIPHLVRHFLLRFAAEEGKRVRAVTAPALAMLTGFAWPGNVRQLENAIFRAVVLAEGDEIGVDEFPQIAALSADNGAGETPLVPRLDVELRPDRPAPGEPLLLDAGAPLSTQPIPAGGANLPLLDSGGEVLPLEVIEAAAIRFAIAHYRGQMSEVARKLRIGRSTLYRKLEQLGLAPGAGKADVAGR
jgi:DNA-binding NtrC family response regulator